MYQVCVLSSTVQIAWLPNSWKARCGRGIWITIAVWPPSLFDAVEPALERVILREARKLCPGHLKMLGAHFCAQAIRAGRSKLEQQWYSHVSFAELSGCNIKLLQVRSLRYYCPKGLSRLDPCFKSILTISWRGVNSRGSSLSYFIIFIVSLL